MANGITEPAMMTPFEIEGAVGERLGIGGGIGQDFQSWRYNVPQGEFGTAYPKSRRKMRMEQEYREYQAGEIAKMKALQAMDLEMDREARMQRDQDFQFLEAKTRADREKRVQDEAGLMIDAMRGAVAPDGTVIANPIRPEDDDAIDRLNNLAGSFKYGIENKAAASMFDMLYKDAMKFQESKMEQSKRDESVAANLSAQAGVPMQELGEYTESGLFKPNLNAIVKVNEELKKKEEAEAEEKAVTTEARKAEAVAKVEERRGIASKEKEIDRDIRAERQRLIEFQGQKESESKNKAIEASKNKILDLRIEKADLRGLVFESEEEAEKANPPSGSTIYIGKKPFKVP